MSQLRPDSNGVHRNGCPTPDVLTYFGAPSGPGWPDRFGLALANWFASKRPSSVPTLSLFTGAGGLDVGFQQAGFDVRVAVERDAACVRTLEANVGLGRHFPNLKPVLGDVASFAVPSRTRFDLILGCPPCQSYSAAGRRAEGVNGIRDERGTLFREYIELLRAVRPRALVFENVAGITGANGGRAWSEILAAFAAAGYRVSFRVLDAADYGVAQHRERMILVGVRRDLGIDFRFPAPTHGPDSLSGRPHARADAAVRSVKVSPIERRATVRGRYGHLLESIPPGLNYTFYTARLGHPAPVFAWRSKFSDFLYKADPARPVRTLKATEGGFTGPFHWTSRPFTAAEKKRLQTIPDEFAMCGNRGEVNAQIGNAVPCQLARLIALAVHEQVFSADYPFRVPTLDEGAELGFRTRKRLMTQLYAERAADHRAGAREASRGPSSFAARSYRARLGSDFDLIEDPGEAAPVFVDINCSDGVWRVQLSCRPQHGRPAFAVALTPIGIDSWLAGLSRIELSGDQLDPTLFAAAWRALGTELSRNGGYADLVQLNGFYRNTQAVCGLLTFGKLGRQSAFWTALAKVVERVGVGETLTSRRLAVVWGLPVRQVRPFVEFMRSLGYEVRSRRTNPQIGPGRFLVPYPFPTLTPKSVQRHKQV